MAPKKKGAGAEAAKATPAAAAAAGGTADAAKEKADALFKKFKTRQDAALVVKLEELVEAAPTAVATLTLVKVCCLQAVNLILKKGRGPPLSLEEQLSEKDRLERQRQEDELEVEVVGILNKALKAAAAGFFAKERSLACLLFAGQLAGLLRGRGSATQVEERRPVVERLHKLAETMARLAGEQKSFGVLAWLDEQRENTVPPRWPLESSAKDLARDNQQQMSQQLNWIWSLFVKCKAADEQACAFGEGGGAAALFRSRPSIEPITDLPPWEASSRVQERLVAWSVLPSQERNDVGKRYRMHVRDEVEAAAAREQAARKVTREQHAKAQKQEEHSQALAQKSQRAAEEQQRKAKAEAEAAAAAQARRAEVQAERAEATRQYLGQRVAAVADEGQEAQQAALAAELRMAVPEVRAGLQRQAQAKERKEAELSLSRVALDHVVASKPVFYALPAELAASVASPAFGGVGAPAVNSAGPPVSGDDDSKGCIERLQRLLVGKGDAVEALAQRVHGDEPCVKLLHQAYPCPDMIDMEQALEVDIGTDAPEPYTRWPLPDGGAPHPEDMQLLARVAREGQAAAVAWVYRRTADDFKRHTPTSAISAVWWDSEAEAAQCAEEAAEAEGTAEGANAAAASTADCAAAAAQAAVAAVPQVLPMADPQRAMSGYLLHTFAATVGHSQNLTDRLLPATSVADELALLTAPPYGHSADWVGLVHSFTNGHQILLLLEAADQGTRPEGWQWWHYAFLTSDVVTGATNKQPSAVRLAMTQPDREAALGQASAADSFVRWLLPQQRALEALILASNAAAEQAQAAQAAAAEAQPQAEAGQPEQQPQEEAGQPERRQQEEARQPEQQPQPQPQDGGPGEQQPGTATAAAAETAAAADAPAAEQQAAAQEGQREGQPQEDESLQHLAAVSFTDQLAEWFMQGLTAVSLAAVHIPPTAAAAAAAASDGGSSGDAAAAWLWDHKRGVADRILCGLRHLHKAGVLLLPMSEAMLEFVGAQAPPAAKSAVTKAAAAAGKVPEAASNPQASRPEQQQGEADAPCPAQEQQQGEADAPPPAQEQQGQHAQQEQQQGEADAPPPAQEQQGQHAQQGQPEQQPEEQAPAAAARAVSLPTAYLLALLPHLPLASLHQLLVFVCLQLAWRFPALPEALHACLAGQCELFRQCLHVHASKGGGKGSGGKGSAGQQLEAAVTQAGLRWALLDGATSRTPFDPQHFLATDVSVGDVIAQLAAAVKLAAQPPAGAVAAAPDRQPPADQQQQQQPPDEGSGGGADAGDVRAAAGTEAGAGGAAGQASAPASGAEELPQFLRIAEGVAAWQPPATLEEQIAQALGLGATPQAAGLVGAAAEANAAAAAAQLDRVGMAAGTARLAVYYAYALHDAIQDGQRAMLNMPRGALNPLQRWLEKYDPSMPLPPNQEVEASAVLGLQAVSQWLPRSEQALSQLSICCVAVENASCAAEARRYTPELLEAAQRLLAERQQAGDAAGARRAQAALEQFQEQTALAESNRQVYLDAANKHFRQLAQAHKSLPTRHASTEVLKIKSALRVLEESDKPGSAAAKEQRRQQAAAARDDALYAIQVLYFLMNDREQLAEEMITHLRYVLEQLVLKARVQQGSLLTFCQHVAHRQLVRDLLLFLLPTRWHDELARQRRSAEVAALLAEEEAEKERRAREEAKERERKEKARQAENEKREAERRAKEEAERKAAAEREQQRKQRATAAAAAAAKAGGGSRKAGGRLGDYQAELDDLEGAEEDEWEELEAEQREREAEARRQEGYNRMLEEAAADGDDGEWTEAAASHASRRQQQGQQGQQGRQPRRQGTPASPPLEPPRVLSVARPALASTPAMAVPKTGRPASAGPTWAEQAAVAAAVAASAEAPASAPSSSSASSATTAAVAPPPEAAAPAAEAPDGSWSFDAWQQQEAPAQEDTELDSLLAGMGIPLAEQPPAASQQLAASPAGPPEEGEDEDEDLRRAIEASMDRSQDVVPSQARWAAASASGGGGGGAAGGGGGGTEEAVPDGVGFTALRNEAGEYNCFLNVIVQCLWQCVEFRQKLAAWGPDVAAADPVVAALQSLFKAFKAQQEGEGEDAPSPNGAAANGKAPGGAADPRSAPASPARPGPPDAGAAAPPTPAKAWQQGHKPAWLLAALDAAASGSNGGSRLEPVDPAKLRDALATLPGRNFAAGEMHDAAEVLLTIYERVMETERRLMGAAPAEGASAVEQVFGLKVQEEVHCSSCGRASHHSGYTQYFCMAQAVMLRVLCDMAPTMGLRLREAADQEMKSCDTDLGGCGLPNSVNHFLERAPRVFTLHLCWATHNEEPADIAATLAAVDETVDLGEVYQGVDRGLHRYALRSMVCYYGQHYQALVLVLGAGNKAKGESGAWLMFDDTRVSRVGTWADVRRKCEAGRIQPSVLFYEAVA